MKAPNIQLYNLFRQDLHLSDGKSLELMSLLDIEYKSGVKEDISALARQMNEGFEKISSRFDHRFEKIDAHLEKIDARLDAHDKRFDALDTRIETKFNAADSKIDIKTAELRTEIHKSHSDTVKWMIGIILGVIALFVGSLLKK